jgi:hypothetical protein
MPGQPTLKAPETGATAKTRRPHKEFEHPAQVVADPALSKDEKRVALDSLEQDARQLATASGEGMTGGEDANLRDVLIAKKTLDLPGADAAFAVVLQTFEAKLAASQGTSAHRAIADAIASIHTARAAMANMDETVQPPPGAAQPGSARELDEELAKEKLDP